MSSIKPNPQVVLCSALILVSAIVFVLFLGAGTSAVRAGVTAAQESPLETPVPVTEVFVPVPSAGGRPFLGVPTILWEAGLGLVLVGLGLAWRRAR